MGGVSESGPQGSLPFGDMRGIWGLSIVDNYLPASYRCRREDSMVYTSFFIVFCLVVSTCTLLYRNLSTSIESQARGKSKMCNEDERREIMIEEL